MDTSTKTTSALVSELDKWISKYVRLNAASESGYCYCVCCSGFDFWTAMDCAHYIGRSHMATRFYLPNLGPALKECNQFDAENHRIRWRERMLPEQREDLELRHQSSTKLTRFELQELIQYYKSEVRILRKQKRL